MAKSQNIQKFILAALVLLSLVLSALLWLSGSPWIGLDSAGKEEQDVSSQSVPSIVDRTLQDVYRPVQYIAHNADDQSAAHALVDPKKQKEINDFLKQAEFDKFLGRQDLAHEDFFAITHNENWLELIYSDDLPIGVFEKQFKNLPKDAADFTYDHVLVSRNDPVTIWLYNYKKQEAAQISVKKFDLPKLAESVSEALANSQTVFSATVKDNTVYLPTEVCETPFKSYVIEKLPNSIYVSYFFPDTSVVDSRTTNNITRYIDLTKEVSINQKTNVLNFLSQNSSSEALTLSERFDASYHVINDLENWQDDVIYHSYSESTHRLCFQRFIEGLPVFHEPNEEAMAELSLEDEGLTYLKLPLRFIQTPIAIQKAPTETLPNGFDVLDRLRAAGYAVTDKIEDLTIGYTWSERKDNEKVVEFKPEWYVRISGRWRTLADVLAKRAEKEVTYEF